MLGSLMSLSTQQKLEKNDILDISEAQLKLEMYAWTLKRIYFYVHIFKEKINILWEKFNIS